MTSTGKLLRSNRFRYANSGVGLIAPIDHGLTVGPLEGLAGVSDLLPWIGHPAITGVLAHKGMIERLAGCGALGRSGVMLQLNGMSAMAPQPDRKELLTSVKTAVRLGADAVSVQVNFDGQNDAHNLGLIGTVVDEAHACGLPVLAMVYDKVHSPDHATALSRLRHLMRIAIELGCDALKLAPPADLTDVPRMLRGMDIPVYFAGGALMSDTATLELARQSVLSGAAGLCLGRNVFQRPEPARMLDELMRTLLHAEAEGTTLHVGTEPLQWNARPGALSH